MGDSRNRPGWGVPLMIGAAVGAVAALLFSTDENGETKAEVKAKVKLLKQKLTEVKESEVVQKIFGQYTKELAQIYHQAKEALISRLSMIKGSIEEIDREKYVKVVNEVVSDLKEQSQVTSTQLNRLKDYLVSDFNKLATSKEKPKKA